MRKISKFEIDVDALDYVEDEVGMSAAGWDTTDPLEIITASINFFIENQLEEYLTKENSNEIG